jgi:hypothetical protein
LNMLLIVYFNKIEITGEKFSHLYYVKLDLYS